MDPRVKELSGVLTGYSCDLKKGEKVLIDYEGECCKPLVRQLIKVAALVQETFGRNDSFLKIIDGSLRLRDVVRINDSEKSIKIKNLPFFHDMELIPKQYRLYAMNNIPVFFISIYRCHNIKIAI